MLLSPFEPKRLAFLRQAPRLATLVLSAGLIGWTLSSSAQTPSAAEEAVKEAIQSGQLEQARKMVQTERKNAPQSVQWRFMEGVIQAQQGQIDKAIDTFKQITQTNPEQSEAYNNLGVLYASKGQLEASKSYLEKALQTHPSYAAAHRNLSDVHSQLAKQNYAKALLVDPKAKASSPQLTLLGSMGTEQRGPSPAQLMASVSRPSTQPAGQATSQTLTSAHAATSIPTIAVASAPVASGKTTSSAALSAAQAQPSAPVAVTVMPAASAAPPAERMASEARQADRAAIDKAVQDWAKAWSDKDMTRYYAAYANDFTPANGASRAQWESDRRIRILSKKSISVKVRELQISFTGGTATVRFQQLYSSDNLKGNSRKTLNMVRQSSRWLIVRESVN